MPLTLPIAGRVLSAFRHQIDRLSERARLVLLVAAAEGTGDVNTVLRAGAVLGTSVADLDVAERAGLLRVTGTSVAFRHPLVRSAAYQGAALTARLTVHSVLADVLDGDRRVWHRAAAATGPDEEIAGELERSAERARARGALAAAVDVYEQAARVRPVSITTVSPALRSTHDCTATCTRPDAASQCSGASHDLWVSQSERSVPGKKSAAARAWWSTCAIRVTDTWPSAIVSTR
jgi:hypothetical protein